MIGIGIGVGLMPAVSELNQAIALLRSVGGRVYLPGLTSRVASDGSGAVPVAGDVIGFLPDRVPGLTANAATQATTAAKPKLIGEILGYTERYSLEFDGVNDYMAASSAATLSDGLVMVWAGKLLRNGPEGFDQPLGLRGSTEMLNVVQSPGTTDIVAEYKVNGVWTAGVSIPTGSVGSANVIACRVKGGLLALRKNGGAWSSTSIPATKNELVKLNLGAAAQGYSHANQSLSAAMVANLGANATDANIAILERAAAQAAGITL